MRQQVLRNHTTPGSRPILISVDHPDQPQRGHERQQPPRTQEVKLAQACRHRERRRYAHGCRCHREPASSSPQARSHRPRQMVGEAQEQSHPKRPVKQVTPRPVTDSLYLACAQGIELGIDLGQRRAVIGLRVAATRRRCHRLQRLLIEFLFARRRRVAHGHGVDKVSMARLSVSGCCGFQDCGVAVNPAAYHRNNSSTVAASS
jgi:hypothetical protein